MLECHWCLLKVLVTRQSGIVVGGVFFPSYGDSVKIMGISSSITITSQCPHQTSQCALCGLVFIWGFYWVTFLKITTINTIQSHECKRAHTHKPHFELGVQLAIHPAIRTANLCGNSSNTMPWYCANIRMEHWTIEYRDHQKWNDINDN